MKLQILRKLIPIVCLLVSSHAFAYDFEVFSEESGNYIYYNILSETDQTVSVTYKDKEYNSYNGYIVIPETVQYEEKIYTVKEIGTSAFRSCSDLLTIKIPSTIINIEQYAFYNSTAITDIYCSSTDQPIEILENTFSAFTALLHIPFALTPNYSSSAYWQEFTIASECVDGIYYKYNDYNSVAVTSSNIWNVNYSGDIVIPESVTIDERTYNVVKIADYAFNVNADLKTIVIPNTVTSIGIGAFKSCKNLETVNIPTDVKMIYKETFEYCTNLISIKIPDSVETIYQYAFRGCSNLYGILELPKNIESIGADAFKNTNYSLCKIQSVAAPTISSTSFPTSFATAIVPTGSSESYKADDVWSTYTIIEEGSCDIEVTNETAGGLAKSIFYQTDATNALITGLTVHGTLNSTDFEFINTNLTSLLHLDISDTDVTEITQSIFVDKATLLSIALPNGLKNIGSSAFKGCSVLNEVTNVPETLDTIGSSAFSGCSSLKTFKIPNSVTSIGTYAFQNCKSLNTIDLSAATALTSISNYMFVGCVTLQSVILPETLTTIGSYAFQNCNKLSDINFSENLEMISSYAFNGCTGLTVLDFSECASFETISSNAFYGCKNITLLDLTDCTVFTTISSNAFKGCSSLRTINLPESLTTIGVNAFADCETLSHITTPPPFDNTDEPFSGVDNIACILTYPTDNMLEYWSANYWGGFIDRTQKSDIQVEIETPEEEDSSENSGSDSDDDSESGDDTGNDSDNSDDNNSDSGDDSIEGNGGGGKGHHHHGGHVWYDRDWHKEHGKQNGGSQAKSLKSISRANLLAETVDATEEETTLDVSSINATVTDGLSLYVQNGDMVSFLIQPEEGYMIETVEYGGEDVTDQLVSGVFTTPEVSTKNTKLRVVFAKETATTVLGEVNADGEVNVTDVTTLISYVLGNTEGVNTAVVDVNSDGEVNVTDVTVLISIILGTN